METLGKERLGELEVSLPRDPAMTFSGTHFCDAQRMEFFNLSTYLAFLSCHFGSFKGL
jgi:hypothetical protein